MNLDEIIAALDALPEEQRREVARKARIRLWKLNNKEHIAKQGREYRDRVKDELRLKKKAAYAANLDVERAKRRAYYAENKQSFSEYGKAKYAENAVAIRNRARAYREANLQAIREKQRAYGKKRSKENRAECNAAWHRYRAPQSKTCMRATR